MAKRKFNPAFKTPAKKSAPAATELPAGISDLVINTAISHNDKICSPGLRWWIFSYTRNGEAVKGAIQLLTEWTNENDAEVYIKRVYIH